MRNNKLLENYIRESIVSLSVSESTLNEVRVFDLIMGAACLATGIGIGGTILNKINKKPAIVKVNTETAKPTFKFTDKKYQEQYEDAKNALRPLSNNNKKNIERSARSVNTNDFADLFKKLFAKFDGENYSVGGYELNESQFNKYLEWLFKNYGSNPDRDYIEEFFADLESEIKRVDKEKENILMNVAEAEDYLEVSPRDPSSMSLDELQEYINEISASGGFKTEVLIKHRAAAIAELTYNDHASANAMSHISDIISAYAKKSQKADRNDPARKNLVALYKQNDLIRQADYVAASAAETIAAAKDSNSQLEALERFDRSIEDVEGLSLEQAEIYREALLGKLDASTREEYLNNTKR